MNLKRLVIIFFCFNSLTLVNASNRFLSLKSKKDTTFIDTYYNDLIIRMYSGEKTHSLDLTDLTNGYRLRYLPNGYFNLGMGFTYRSFGISLATKVPLFQNSLSKHGDTQRLGIQYYLYAGKFSVDVLGSFSKGYYLKRSYTHLSDYPRDKEYLRPDISSANLGVTVNYIFNHSKFSYKAAFSDNERQKKSAGSLIAGGGVYSYQTVSDSAFVPREILLNYFKKSRDVSKSGVLAFNGNVGYAYSIVFLKNGIVTLAYILGSGIQDNSFHREVLSNVNRWHFSMNHTGRLGIGYRFRNYYARLGIIRSNQYTALKYNDLGIGNGTNFAQISLGKRLTVGKKKSLHQ